MLLRSGHCEAESAALGTRQVAKHPTSSSGDEFVGRGRFPDPWAVISGDAGYAATVGCPFGATHPSCVSAMFEYLGAGSRIPNADGAVPRSGGDSAPVGGPARVEEGQLPAAEHLQLDTLPRPYARYSVVRRCQQPAPVRSPG